MRGSWHTLSVLPTLLVIGWSVSGGCGIGPDLGSDRAIRHSPVEQESGGSNTGEQPCLSKAIGVFVTGPLSDAEEGAQQKQRMRSHIEYRLRGLDSRWLGRDLECGELKMLIYLEFQQRPGKPASILPPKTADGAYQAQLYQAPEEMKRWIDWALLVTLIHKQTGNIPRWLSRGISGNRQTEEKRAEYRDRARRWMSDGSWPTMNELLSDRWPVVPENEGPKRDEALEHEAELRATAFWLFEFLLDKGTEQQLLDYLVRLKMAGNDQQKEQAFALAYGFWGNLYAARSAPFEEFVKDRLLHPPLW